MERATGTPETRNPGAQEAQAVPGRACGKEHRSLRGKASGETPQLLLRKLPLGRRESIAKGSGRAVIVKARMSKGMGAQRRRQVADATTDSLVEEEDRKSSRHIHRQRMPQAGSPMWDMNGIIQA